MLSCKQTPSFLPNFHDIVRIGTEKLKHSIKNSSFKNARAPRRNLHRPYANPPPLSTNETKEKVNTSENVTVVIYAICCEFPTKYHRKYPSLSIPRIHRPSDRSLIRKRRDNLVDRSRHRYAIRHIHSTQTFVSILRRRM